MEGRRRKYQISTVRRCRILVRDQQRCRYCGCELDPFSGDGTPTLLTLDHVVPVCQGGSSRADNLVVSCAPCNDRKGNRTPEQAGMRLLPAPGVLKVWYEKTGTLRIVERSI